MSSKLLYHWWISGAQSSIDYTLETYGGEIQLTYSDLLLADNEVPEYNSRR